jgi:uncharacterized protein DUF7005
LSRQEYREAILATCGATCAEIQELSHYNENLFDHTRNASMATVPLPDEPFVSAWHDYATDAKEVGAFVALQKRLPQLRFPVGPHIGETKDYRAATRRGASTEGMASASGLALCQPESLRIELHQTPAGKIPLLIPACRQDFVLLVQALTKRNEPVPIPASMGACVVAGYNNWDRIRLLRTAWAKDTGEASPDAGWEAEFRRIQPQKDLYQDRFIILSDGPYSGVPARALGLSEREWRDMSFVIRREHEATHYFTRRALHSMRNNLLDELIADYVGIVAATGKFQAAWFLTFMGLELFPQYRQGGRLQNYRGDPPLSDGAFSVLGRVVKLAAENVQAFHAERHQVLNAPGNQALAILVLTGLTLEELASPSAVQDLSSRLSGLTTLDAARDS